MIAAFACDYICRSNVQPKHQRPRLGWTTLYLQINRYSQERASSSCMHERQYMPRPRRPNFSCLFEKSLMVLILSHCEHQRDFASKALRCFSSRSFSFCSLCLSTESGTPVTFCCSCCTLLLFKYTPIGPQFVNQQL